MFFFNLFVPSTLCVHSKSNFKLLQNQFTTQAICQLPIVHRGLIYGFTTLMRADAKGWFLID